MTMKSNVTEMLTVRIPVSLERNFDKQIKPLGQFLNFPDFVRDAVREKQNKILGVKS